MRFNELAWAGLCFYYRSVGDRRYSAIMSDHEFLTKLRYNPEELSMKEFEEKAILGFINIQNYDLLIEHKLTESILTKIIQLRDEISMLRDLSLIECNLDDQKLVKGINCICSELYVDGLWATGASKIAHLLNDRLLPPISLDIARHFGIQYRKDVTPWLLRMQCDIQEATDDFHTQKFEGAPEKFLSDRLRYTALGYEKALVKFADEYYWLCYDDKLPIPPYWVPFSN